MVSGFITSPYDQPRIASGEARLILMASKLLTSNTRPRSLRSLREYPPLGTRDSIGAVVVFSAVAVDSSPENSRKLTLDIVPPPNLDEDEAVVEPCRLQPEESP